MAVLATSEGGLVGTMYMDAALVKRALEGLEEWEARLRPMSWLRTQIDAHADAGHLAVNMKIGPALRYDLTLIVDSIALTEGTVDVRNPVAPPLLTAFLHPARAEDRLVAFRAQFDAWMAEPAFVAHAGAGLRFDPGAWHVAVREVLDHRRLEVQLPFSRVDAGTVEAAPPNPAVAPIPRVGGLPVEVIATKNGTATLRFSLPHTSLHPNRLFEAVRGHPPRPAPPPGWTRLIG
ncbi:MAG: hypothetical protein ABMA64_42655 [Myxococcota bacterium]